MIIEELLHRIRGLPSHILIKLHLPLSKQVDELAPRLNRLLNDILKQIQLLMTKKRKPILLSSLSRYQKSASKPSVNKTFHFHPHSSFKETQSDHSDLQITDYDTSPAK